MSLCSSGLWATCSNLAKLHVYFDCSVSQFCLSVYFLFQGNNVGWFQWSIFRISEIIIFLFVVVIYDLVQDV